MPTCKPGSCPAAQRGIRMHSPIFHDPSWDQSRTCCKAQGTLCRGSALRGNGWIGLQADGWHRPSGKLPVGTEHRGNISVPAIKLKGDTPFPPTLLSYKAGILLWLEKAVGDTVWSPTADGKQAVCAEGIKAGYVLPNQLRKQTLGSPWNAVLNCVTRHQKEYNSPCSRQGQQTILRDHR